MEILGRDLGVSSPGTLIADTATEEIIHAGVMVFPAGVDRYGSNREQSKKTVRREARQMRCHYTELKKALKLSTNFMIMRATLVLR